MHSNTTALVLSASTKISTSSCFLHEEEASKEQLPFQFIINIIMINNSYYQSIGEMFTVIIDSFG